MSSFPTVRMRRLRRTPALRNLVAETRLHLDQLIQPIFLVPGEGTSEPLEGLQGISRESVDRALVTLEADLELGLKSFLLFGVPEEAEKHPEGSWAHSENSEVARFLREATARGLAQDSVLVPDLCLCAYTSHGHCGVVDEEGRVDNDPTLAILGQTAVAYARAGATMVAPSDMMDGRVGAIRGALDEAGFSHLPILSYAAKFASAFYGPFREAAGSAPGKGERKGYQMDPRNGREALLEGLLDEAEGADILMVKPALAYLDVIRQLRDATLLPLAAYHVSGEYAMVVKAAEAGLGDEREMLLESLVAMRRAGADILITYAARRMAADHWIA